MTESKEVLRKLQEQIFFPDIEPNPLAAHSKRCKQTLRRSIKTVKESIVDEQQAIESFLKKRDEETFCALFKAVYGRLRRYFLLHNADAMTAEELAQNVLLGVYRRAGEFQDHKLFRGWLFAIARNELLQHWRRNRARIQTVELEPLREVLAETRATDAEALLRLEFEAWLNLLEPAERELAWLRFVEGLSHEELAAVYAVPRGTIKSRLFYLKRKLCRSAGVMAQGKQRPG